MRSNDDILALMDTAVKVAPPGRVRDNAGIHESDLTTDVTVDSLQMSRCGTRS